MTNYEFSLRYGCNPHQTPARLYGDGKHLPVQVLNGAPGYINLLDALNSWQLVRELRQALGLPAAASFKHVSPAGAAVAVPLPETLQRAYAVEEVALSPIAAAYARARGSDRVSSFGDWVAVSDPVDMSLANLLRREVSDGIIAPAYEQEALSILRQKKQGKYVVLQIDPAYEPTTMETREVFGLVLEQRRNEAQIDAEKLENVVTRNRTLPEPAIRDLLIALITLKYTQSNSICFALDGQTIGVGAGQQSRIHCTRLAASKAETWFLRQHPAVLTLPLQSGLRRPERDNAIDQFLREDLTGPEESAWQAMFAEPLTRLSALEKQKWIEQLQGVSLASDGYIPFRDSIDRAGQTGVKYIAQPGGSLRDREVIQACNAYDMVMAFTDLRLFHH